MDPAETTLLAGGPSTGDESGRGSAASLKFPSSIALLPGPQPWLALAVAARAGAPDRVERG